MTRITIDRSAIPQADLDREMTRAAYDPRGQDFPWRYMYPLVGQTVYHGGRLWTVVRKEPHAPDADIDIVRLYGCHHDDSMWAARGDLRPVCWTQTDEDNLATGVTPCGIAMQIGGGPELRCSAPAGHTGSHSFR